MKKFGLSKIERVKNRKDFQKIYNKGRILYSSQKKLKVNLNDNKLKTTASQSIDLPAFDIGLLEIYLDTTGIAPGQYDLVIEINYADKIKTVNDKLTVSAQKGVQYGSNGMLAIALIVIALIIAVIAPVLKKRKQVI